MLGFAKSTLCKWLKQEQYKRPKLSGEVLEVDGVWALVADGKVELKVARRCAGIGRKLGRRSCGGARAGRVGA